MAPQTPIVIGGRRSGTLGAVPPSYLRELDRAGARPVVVHPGGESSQEVSEVMDSVTGLLLTGGDDVTPKLSGAPFRSDYQVDELRDELEAQLLAAARAREMPILAICRGMQLLNVVQGGTLRDVAADTNHGRPGDWAVHPVTIADGSLLQRIVPVRTLESCSSHHRQVVDRLASDLRAAAWSDDGAVEAVEDPLLPWVLGVQWHPEDTAPDDELQRSIFMSFVDAARRYGKVMKAASNGRSISTTTSDLSST